MQSPRPLDNPLIFGNFNVAFSSTQRAPNQSGQREPDLTCCSLLCAALTKSAKLWVCPILY